MLLGRHIKKRFVNAFISDMKKKVPTPKLKIPWLKDMTLFTFLSWICSQTCSVTGSSMMQTTCALTQMRIITLNHSSQGTQRISLRPYPNCGQPKHRTHCGRFQPRQEATCSPPPPNFYADKTGKHINQWYPQEPWMFMTTLLRRKTCESADSWQQLDFLPSLDVIGTPNNDKEGPVSNDSQSKLQLNHKNSEGTLKALVHSVEYKKERLPTHLTLPPTNPP